MSRPTPETDAAKLNHSYGVVDIDFARKLERERDKAKEVAKEADLGHDMAIADLAKCERELGVTQNENAELRSTIKNLLDYLKQIQENSGQAILHQLAATIARTEKRPDQNKNCETVRGIAKAFKKALDKAGYIN